MRHSAALAAACLLLAGCGREPAPPSQPDEAAPSTAAASNPLPADAQIPTPTGAPSLTPEAERGETGARNVLLEWARDLERGDYDGAYALWLDGARSGMDAAQHRTFWQKYRTITVTAPTGTMEGAAGSSYYSAPVTIAGEDVEGQPYSLSGTVVLKRINDVPGATPDQLRWHLEKVELSPQH